MKHITEILSRKSSCIYIYVQDFQNSIYNSVEISSAQPMQIVFFLCFFFTTVNKNKIIFSGPRNVRGMIVLGPGLNFICISKK